MSNDYKLSSPRLLVVVDTGSAEGYTQYDVQTDNRDLVRYDLMKARKGWPTQREAPIVFMTAVAWAALKREGYTTDDVEAYMEKIVDITPVDDKGEALDPNDLEGEDGTASPLA